MLMITYNNTRLHDFATRSQQWTNKREGCRHLALDYRVRYLILLIRWVEILCNHVADSLPYRYAYKLFSWQNYVAETR